MKGDRVEIVIDAGGATRNYEVTATGQQEHLGPRPYTRSRPSMAFSVCRAPHARGGGQPYPAARAFQRDPRYSTWRGTPKHLDRFAAVNTSGSGPAASTEPFRSSMACVNPSGTSST